MKKSRFFLGLVLLLGLLCVANFFNSKEVNTTNVTEVQVGWALSKHVDRHGDGIERATLEIGVAYTVQG